MLKEIYGFFMCVVSLKTWYEKHIKIFLTTWNQLRVSLATNGKYKHQQYNTLSYINTGLSNLVIYLDSNTGFQVRLRSRLSSARTTWTSTVTSGCCYHVDKAQACALQRLSATSLPCTMTWSTVWINTPERRPGGGAHATFFSLAHVWL